MYQLLVSGLIYLIVIGVILAIKPRLMFREDGSWKEFGIGRNPNTHTWMPFWLFAVLWAMISYIGTSLVLGYNQKPSVVTKPVTKSSNRFMEDVDADEVLQTMTEENFVTPKRKSTKRNVNPVELPEGYYVLNAKATESAGGIPKYVFLGKGLPE